MAKTLKMPKPTTVETPLVKKNTHGGFRVGAGRKKSGRPLRNKVVQICLTEEEMAEVEAMGGSRWMRQLALDTIKMGPSASDGAIVVRLPKRESPEHQPSLPPLPPFPQWFHQLEVPLGTLPVFSSQVACGFPSPAEDYDVEEIDLNARLIAHPAATFVVQAQGLSMTQAGIDPGDYLLVDRSLEPRNKDVVLAFIDNEFTIKRIVFGEKGVEFHPDTDAPGFDVIYPNEESSIGVYGVVTSIIKELR